MLVGELTDDSRLFHGQRDDHLWAGFQCSKEQLSEVARLKQAAKEDREVDVAEQRKANLSRQKDIGEQLAAAKLEIEDLTLELAQSRILLAEVPSALTPHLSTLNNLFV